MIRISTPLLSAFLFISTSVSGAAQSAEGKTVAIDAQSIAIAMGYDSLRGSFITDKTCIVYAEAEGGGTKTEVSLSEVTDQQSLAKSLNIDAALQVDMLLGKGEGKVGFTGSSKISTSSQHFSAYARAQSRERYAAPVDPDAVPAGLLASGGAANTALSMDAQEVDAAMRAGRMAGGAKILLAQEFADLARDDRDAFFRACGDSFVRVLRGGAEVIGLVSFETSSAESQAEIRAAMKAQGTSWSASTDAKAKMEEFSKSGRLQLDYYETGGDSEKVPTDWEGILDRVRSIKELAKTPRFYEVEVLPYSVLFNWPDQAKPVVEPDRNPLTYHFAAYRSIFLLVEDMLKPEGRDLKYLLWRGITEDDIEDLSDDLQDIMDEVRPRLEACDQTGETEAAINCGADGLPDPYEFRVRLPFAFPPPDAPGRYDHSTAFLFRAELTEAIADQRIRAYRTAACQTPGHPACIRNARIRDLIKQIPSGKNPINDFRQGTITSTIAVKCLFQRSGKENYAMTLVNCLKEPTEPGDIVYLDFWHFGRWIPPRVRELSTCISVADADPALLVRAECTPRTAVPDTQWRYVDFTPRDSEKRPYMNGRVMTGDGRCLTRSDESEKLVLFVKACDRRDKLQRWDISIRQF